MSAAIRAAPLAFWAIAQTFLNTLFALFGAPEAVAFQHTHTSRQRALMLPWLCAGEALMRRLLLLEASAYPKPNTRPLLARARAKRARKLVGFDDDNPETWRVSFRTLAAADRRLPAGRPALQHVQVNASRNTECRLEAGGPQRKQRLSRYERAWREPKPTKFYSAVPLALRYEALLPVFNTPAPFAKRLAARLHATPHRIRELMRLPARRRARKAGERADTPDLIGAGFPALESACGSSFAAFNSS